VIKRRAQVLNARVDGGLLTHPSLPCINVKNICPFLLRQELAFSLMVYYCVLINHFPDGQGVYGKRTREIRDARFLKQDLMTMGSS